ncbi:voltage-dependent calcium channel gamma-6 subunit isoform X2 [Gracilinanus agilis]|uniref:voltage-dependent calcium channel gamma-6 subunit isoform X2 n=1 Tax=Gracilinanus agilis TaxID=191870 RepID=UPI001CFC6DC0|nr:voltage-dependent calcium channel gamma-6 subunit isoform X2 [Gracilinanus agilis]
MMWSNFFIQEEERRRADTVRRRTQRTGLARERRGPIKLALLLSGMGTALAVLAVGTEFWVELGTKRGNGTSGVCEAAHLGLWRVCAKRLWLEDLPPNRETCGPAELPGEANCSYFRFFTTGENNQILQRTTKKGVLLLVSLQLFRQGVHALLARTGPTPAPWLGYEYSWSVACALAAAGLLLLGGGSFLLLALPSRTLKMCCRQQPGDQGGGGAT